MLDLHSASRYLGEVGDLSLVPGLQHCLPRPFKVVNPLLLKEAPLCRHSLQQLPYALEFCNFERHQ